MRVRRADESDLDELLVLLEQLALDASEVHRRVSPSARQRAVWADILGQPDRTVLIAETDRIAGTADLLIVSNITHGGAPWAAVENVVVDKGSRRQGIGRALLDEIVTRSREAGCYKVQLLSNEVRLQAHAFYRAYGFVGNAAGFRFYLD